VECRFTACRTSITSTPTLRARLGLVTPGQLGSFCKRLTSKATRGAPGSGSRLASSEGGRFGAVTSLPGDQDLRAESSRRASGAIRLHMTSPVGWQIAGDAAVPPAAPRPRRHRGVGVAPSSSLVRLTSDPPHSRRPGRRARGGPQQRQPGSTGPGSSISDFLAAVPAGATSIRERRPAIAMVFHHFWPATVSWPPPSRCRRYWLSRRYRVGHAPDTPPTTRAESRRYFSNRCRASGSG
jgi:hypothetical protein